MPAPDVAYGRAEDNSDEWGYMITTTPGCCNAGGITTTILPQPLFSEVGGLKTNATQLTISLPDEEFPDDVALCVTLDGHEPLLSDKVDAPYQLTIDTTTVVRAKLLSNKAVSPLSLTHSYIYYQQASENPLPVISITTNHEYLYNEEWGILGVPMEDTEASNIEWRRPINIEYFTDGEAIFNQVGETRVQGSWSRRYAQRSLAVYANKRFGEKRYNVTFWKDKPNVTKVKSFTLRNSGNDFLGSHIKDAFAQTLAGRHCDNLDWMAYQPCICFINGIYKGIYDIRERSNEDYIEANYDGLEDIDMFENWYEKKAGSQAGLDSLFAAIHDSNVTFETIDSLVDLEELNNNFIINSFITNTDYPFNNHVIWRNLTVENSKWEFVMKDMDRTAYESFDFDYFNFLYENYEKYIGKYNNLAAACKIYIHMLEVEQLRNLFLDRYIVYLGDFLQYDTAINLLYEMIAEIEGEYYNHCSVYFENPEDQMMTWKWNYKKIDSWWAQRLDFMKEFLGEYFELGEAVPVTINAYKNNLKINNIPLTQEVFNGAFYSNRMMHIAVEEADCNYNITTTYADGTSTSRNVKSQELDLQVTPDQVAVTIEIITPNGIIEPDNDRCDVIAGDNVITVNGNRPIEQVVLYDIMHFRFNV